MNTNEYLSTACVATAVTGGTQIDQLYFTIQNNTVLVLTDAVKNEVPIIVIVFVNQTNDGFSIIPSMFGEHEDDDGYRAPGKLNAKKTGERNTILTIVYFLNSQLFPPLSIFGAQKSRRRKRAKFPFFPYRICYFT